MDPDRPTKEQYIQVAIDRYSTEEGDISIADDATVFQGDETGAWVEAWVYIRDSDADYVG